MHHTFLLIREILIWKSARSNTCICQTTTNLFVALIQVDLLKCLLIIAIHSQNSIQIFFQLLNSRKSLSNKLFHTF